MTSLLRFLSLPAHVRLLSLNCSLFIASMLPRLAQWRCAFRPRLRPARSLYAYSGFRGFACLAMVVALVFNNPVEMVWFDDALPAGMVTASHGGASWDWGGWSPHPHSGNVSHQSSISSGLHGHYFESSPVKFPVRFGGKLYTYVYIDPENIPEELMLQWWEPTQAWAHGAYWGANRIDWGADGTQSRRYMGPMPAAEGWVRLETPASAVGLEGKDVAGMAFTLYGGRVNWDYSGVEGTKVWNELVCEPDCTLRECCHYVQREEYENYVMADDSIPAGATPGARGGDSWYWTGWRDGLDPGTGLDYGQTLSPGQSLRSPNGQFVLTHQTDGNVALSYGGYAHWTTNTHGQATTVLVMQYDGNLALYNGDTPIWASNTAGQGFSQLAVQDDGNVVIYKKMPNGPPTWATNTASSAKSWKVGVAHVDTDYHYTSADFLNEGADRIQYDIRSHVIKLWMGPGYRTQYPFNSNWPTVSTLTELAQTPYYQNVLSRAHFKTIVLVVDEFNVGWNSWQDGDCSAADCNAVRSEQYDLARYLLQTYANTGKTFILSNWESDNALNDLGRRIATPAMRNAFIGWMNCRQAGINQARAEVGMNGVVVAGAMEVNAIYDPLKPWVGERAVNSIVPYTHMDLYSYSSWEVYGDTSLFTANLNTLAAKAPDSALYGSKNIYIGELGYAEAWQGTTVQRDVIQAQTQTALDWGVQWLIYWQLFDKPTPPPNSSNDCYCLIRYDGSHPLVYYYLKDLMVGSP